VLRLVDEERGRLLGGVSVVVLYRVRVGLHSHRGWQRRAMVRGKLWESADLQEHCRRRRPLPHERKALLQGHFQSTGDEDEVSVDHGAQR
jgi:hypothetical protein